MQLNLPLIFMPIIMIVSGFVIAFSGYKLFKFTLALSGFFFGLFLSFELLSTTIENKNTLIIVALVIAVIFSIIIFYFYQIGVFAAGGFAGFALTQYLELYYKNPTDLLIILIIVIAAGILAIIFQKAMIIISTSLSGAFLFVNGFGYLIFSLKYGLQEIENYTRYVGENKKLVILFFAASFITALFGLVSQLKTRSRQR